MEIGIIGTGNMGRILTEALWMERPVSPSSMIITNRTISKAMTIQKNYPDIHITEDIEEIGKTSRFNFYLRKTT